MLVTLCRACGCETDREPIPGPVQVLAGQSAQETVYSVSDRCEQLAHDLYDAFTILVNRTPTHKSEGLIAAEILLSHVLCEVYSVVTRRSAIAKTPDHLLTFVQKIEQQHGAPPAQAH